MTDDPVTTARRGVPVQRVLYRRAVHFKGKGFYNTDYGTKRRTRELRASAERAPTSTRPSRPTSRPTRPPQRLRDGAGDEAGDGQEVGTDVESGPTSAS